MAELAGTHQTRAPMTATTVADRRGIPEKYLVHILLQLKRAGLVHSVRGAQGGYIVAKSIEHITLYDIVTAIDGAILDPLPVSGSAPDELGGTWREAAQGIQRVLESISLRDMSERSAKSNMYYI